MPQDKKRLQEDDKNLRKLLSAAMEDAGELSHETAELLLKWNPYDQTKSTPFFDPHWMFGIENGFDIVIGNPPYVFTRGSDFSHEFKEYVTKNYFSALQNNRKTKSTQSGKINLFTLFILKGIWLSKPNGIISYIVPNNLLRTTTYDTVRKYILENSTIDELVDLGSGVFHNVTASTIIFKLINAKNKNNTCKIITNIKNIKNKQYTTTKIKQKQFLNNVSYTFNIYANVIVKNLLDKIHQNKKILDDFSRDIIAGIVAHQHLLFDKPVNHSLPLVIGKTIKKYGINNIQRHILWNTKEIHRTRPDYLWDTDKKIILQRISGGSNPLTATLDTNKYKTFASVNNILLKPCFNDKYEYILALLNSKVLNWYYANKFSNNSTLTVNISKTYLSQLPISDVTPKKQQAITDLVNQILSTKNKNPNADTTKLESKIDRLVYELYDLTENEIKIIEG
jgi:hypothetical protein